LEIFYIFETILNLKIEIKKCYFSLPRKISNVKEIKVTAAIKYHPEDDVLAKSFIINLALSQLVF
tara:strand:+ start:251 stop:445 length:195 start_codon:yes stop_codon:yes gene_type:complete